MPLEARIPDSTFAVPSAVLGQLPTAVTDKTFRGPEAQFFEGPIFSLQTNVAWCPHNTRVHHTK